MMKKLLFLLTVSALFWSCEKETLPEAGKVIFIHASEGGYGNTKKVSYDTVTTEKQITIMFANEMKQHLENRGYEVIVSESDNSILTYDEIKKQASGKEIKALLQITTGWSPAHMRERYTGIGLFYSKRFSASKQLDSLISRSITVHSNIMARNLGMRNSMILNLPDIPGIKMELGNINNKNDLAKMLDGKYRQNIIDAITYALDEFINSYN